MKEYIIDRPHPESSAIIAIQNQRLLDAFGWEVGFWTASDEAPAHQAIAALGKRKAAPGEGGSSGSAEQNGGPAQGAIIDDSAWTLVPCKCKRSGATMETDDSEAMARAGSWIYLFGSQFGSKEGPLDPARAFVARFNEALVKIKPEKPKLKFEMEVACPGYWLHRVVNDALRERDLDLLEQGRQTMQGYIHRTIADLRKNEEGALLLRLGDYPINIEGVTFLPNGHLLAGLRYPVTAKGQPILVEIDGLDRLFEEGEDDVKRNRKYGRPAATRVLILSNVGSREKPRGIRAMDQRGDRIHVITGDLDSDPDDSLVLGDHPEGFDANVDHREFTVPPMEAGILAHIRTRRLRSFGDDANVEGLALFDDGTVWYCHDEDEHIRLHAAAGCK